ncbi:hypothetical protein ACFQBQ_15550 [Granulicella cerasi]|uniref:Uncharacterized protein n=1 Tax=Granulicella cerasi TaxID=741063 RepID=A0ABW1ZDB4_9BACT
MLESIVQYDEHTDSLTLRACGHTITLDGNGVTVASQTTLTLSAGTEAAISGVNVTHTALANFTAKGNSAELSSSGETVVKGALVMIN